MHLRLHLMVHLNLQVKVAFDGALEGTLVSATRMPLRVDLKAHRRVYFEIYRKMHQKVCLRFKRLYFRTPWLLLLKSKKYNFSNHNVNDKKRCLRGSKKPHRKGLKRYLMNGSSHLLLIFCFDLPKLWSSGRE